MFLSAFFSSEGMNTLPNAYLFGPEHITYLISALISFILLFFLFVKKSEETRKWFITILCILMILLKYGGEVIFVSEWIQYRDQISSYSHPFWDIRTFFSFQMCGVNNILLPLVIWFNWKPLKDFVYASSILGGLAVMLYPAGVLFGDPFMITFPMLRSLIVHFLLAFIPCFLIATEEFSLKPVYWKRTLIGLLGLTAWAMFGNLFIDPSANNMYLMTNPFYGGPIPILNIVPNGFHVLLLAVLVYLGYVIVYQFSKIFQNYYLKQTHQI